jgi:L-alanine-DL-glutamate epimerase-like enolase superfamily enzyme
VQEDESIELARLMLNNFQQIVLKKKQMKRAEAIIRKVWAGAYRIPTDYPESDGTLEWNSTTLVLVFAEAEGKRGLGYTYADEATACLVQNLLKGVVEGRSALDCAANWSAMLSCVRNLGRPGIASMAIAAVDTALWDLKARILGLPLLDLIGGQRGAIPVYGSGGFTSYDNVRLCHQLAGWAEQGISRVKMKIGREPDRDLERVRAARSAIGPAVELFVDANGAYNRRQALKFAEQFSDLGVTWFEEPVSSDDLDGLRLMRDRAPAQMDVAAGEYGYDVFYFRRMLESGAVDVLQADASRCGGASGFLRLAALCEAMPVALSAHCCPALHLHLCCAVRPAIHLEYFHDHVRIEQMLFEGAASPKDGVLYPDLSRPGIGIELKKSEADKYAL